MIDLATLSLFVASAILLAFSPGPDNVFVLTLSMARGAMVGIVTTLGLCTGLIVHTLAVALGVAVIIQQSAVAFSVLKYGGALYLGWLAWKVFKSRDGEIRSKGSSEGYSRLYLRGVIMNLMNPKVSLFFLAFLPQFTDPARGSVTVQILVLGLLFILSALLVFGGISLSAGRLGDRFRSGRGALLLHRLSGVVFAGLAIKLFFAER